MKIGHTKTKTTTRWTVACLAAVGLLCLGTTAQADPAPTPPTQGVVNINTATAEQLGLLPGIGETKARAIVEHRQRRPFARVDDIVSVRGIGRATLRRLRPYLAVRGDTTLTRPVTPPREATPERTAAAARPAAPAARPAAPTRR